MLYQELPPVDQAPLDGAAPWLIPALALGAGLTGALLAAMLGYLLPAGLLVAAGLVGAVALRLTEARAKPPVVEPVSLAPDYGILGSALGLSRDPAALTSGEGSLLVANSAYRDRFGGARSPLELAADDVAVLHLVAAIDAVESGARCVPHRVLVLLEGGVGMEVL